MEGQAMLTRSAVSVAALGAILLAASGGAALASGGGGGGGGGEMGSFGVPSQSAPAYDPTVEYNHGIDALKAGKFREAQHDFDHSLSVDPKNADTLFMLGVAQAEGGDLRGAVRTFEKSLKIDADQIAARREYAVALAKLGRTADAQAQLAMLKTRTDTCADTCPQAADLKAAMAAVQAALSPSGGATRAPASLLVDPKAGDQSYVIAVRLINDHKYHEALAELAKAEAAFGPHPDVLTYIGYSWRKLGQYDKAETYYREALTIDPQHVGATEYYGELMVERGDLAGAKKMLTKLETECRFGCVESEDLRRWIENGPPAS
jgi:tetratricopeptide (TPR) repeat protein